VGGGTNESLVSGAVKLGFDDVASCLLAAILGVAEPRLSEANVALVVNLHVMESFS
jgi:hypothetical protein